MRSKVGMVGIVIVSYKNAKTTSSFINEQLAKVKAPCKVVVVDNSPTESTAREIAKTCNGVFLTNPSEAIGETERNVFVVSTGNNLGFARGNNLGAEILLRNFSIEYLLFSNDDIIIKDGDVVEKLMNCLRGNPEVGVVGPRIVGRDNRDQSPHYRVITPLRQIGWALMPWLRRRKHPVSQSVAEPESGYCYWVSGCFFMVRKEDFVLVEGFDTRTFLYSEEVILAERMKLAGKREYFLADTCVTHLGGCSTKNLQSQSLREFLIQSNSVYYRHYLHSNPLLVWLYKKICR